MRQKTGMHTIKSGDGSDTGNGSIRKRQSHADKRRAAGYAEDCSFLKKWIAGKQAILQLAHTQAAQDGAEEGLVISRGATDRRKGQERRTGSSPPGSNLFLQRFPRPGGRLRKGAYATLPMALAVAQSIAAGEQGGQIKWPSDAVIGREKGAPDPDRNVF